MYTDDDWNGTTTRRKKAFERGDFFGPTNMDPARRGRKRTGKSAGGWNEDTLW